MDDYDVCNEEQPPDVQYVKNSKNDIRAKRAYALDDEQKNFEENVLMNENKDNLAVEEDNKNHSVTRDKRSRNSGITTKKSNKNVSQHQNNNNLNVEKRVGKLQVGMLVCLLKFI